MNGKTKKMKRNQRGEEDLTQIMGFTGYPNLIKPGRRRIEAHFIDEASDVSKKEPHIGRFF